MDTPIESLAERVKRQGRYSVCFDATNGIDDEQCRILEAEGWAVARSPDFQIYDRARGLLCVTEAHYWRARRALEDRPLAFQRRVHGKRYYGRYCKLEIDVYTKHWMAANGAQVEEKALLEYLEKEWGYTPEVSRFLPEGCTIYQEPHGN